MEINKAISIVENNFRVNSDEYIKILGMLQELQQYRDKQSNGICLVVPGRPVPAVRMTQSSKYVNDQAQRYLAYKSLAGWTGRAGIKQLLSASTNVSVSIKFYIYKGQTPDIDNLIKAILDGLNGIAWQDDKQVVRVVAERLTAGSKSCERAEVEIRTV